MLRGMSLRIVATLAVLVLVAVTANACAWMGCIDNGCAANKGTWVENDDEKCGGHCEYPPSRPSSSWSPSPTPSPSPSPSATSDASADAPFDAEAPDGEVTSDQ
jgi:hypothetical protein